MSGLNLIRITHPAGAGFRDAMAIYEAAIPKPEQKTRAQILEGFSDPAFRFWALERDGGVVAVAILYVSDALNFCLLEYMAVSPFCQGLGLGSEMFRLSWEASRVDGATLLLIEVDCEAEITSDEERRIRLSRKRFYRRLGCTQVEGFRYIYPLENFGPAPMMNLLVAGAESGEMETVWLRQAVAEIYRQVYQCAPDDARIAQMFAAKGPVLQLA